MRSLEHKFFLGIEQLFLKIDDPLSGA